MAKTQSQAENIAVKKEEEEEEDDKSILGLRNVRNTRSNNKITKRKPSILKNDSLAPQVKLEEDTDTKSLLQSLSNSSTLPKGQTISQEQINQLIHYIVNDNMAIVHASRKANICTSTGIRYYNLYKNNPEKRIPLPRNRYMYPRNYCTQERIGNLIRYINDDKMTVRGASAKANVSYSSGQHYYNKYLKDPGHTIPIPRMQQSYTQEQRDEFISYIVSDKMSIKAASKKAKINLVTAYDYYRKYFKQQNPDIPAPNHIATYKPHTHCTQEQIKELISYIVDDKMSIAAASRKTNISPDAGKRHYRQYLKDNGMMVPVQKYIKRYTQDDLNKLVGYIVDDKMNMSAASKKANVPYSTAKRFFEQFVKEHHLDIFTSKYKQDKINQFITYIVTDKMTIKAASEKANINYRTGRNYYQRYRYNIDAPIPKRTTQDQINKLIRYIVIDKMTIKAASKKGNMSCSSGQRYYRQYLSTRRSRIAPASQE